MRFNQVTIVGVGLIGGSFALALRRAGLAGTITGWDTPEVLERARSRGIIDSREESFESDAACRADLIYLASPVCAIADFLRTRSSLIRPDALVTDAGSTKREICRAAREGLRIGASFVGGHPMAGSHRSGVEFANPDLFQNAPYAIITSANRMGQCELTSPVERVVQIVNLIGARPVLVTAEEHDYLTARISHAVQMISTSLAAAAERSNDRGRREALAGNGFSDMIRLAQSDWSIWEDICRTNPDEIATALREVVVEVERIREAIESGDLAALAEAFQMAGKFAARFDQSRAGSHAS